MGEEEKLWRTMRRLGTLTLLGLVVPFALPVTAAIAVPSLAWMTLTIDSRRVRTWLLTSTVVAGIVAALGATALLAASSNGHTDVVLAMTWIGAYVGFGAYAHGMAIWCFELGWTPAARRWTGGSWLMGVVALGAVAVTMWFRWGPTSEPRQPSWGINFSSIPVNGFGAAVVMAMAVLMILGFRQMWHASRAFFVAWRSTGRSPLRPDDASDTALARSS